VNPILKRVYEQSGKSSGSGGEEEEDIESFGDEPNVHEVD
jgi:hypothetical protein